MLPVFSTDGQITTGLPMSLTQVSGVCLFLVQMVRLLLVAGLPVSLTQVSGNYLFLVQMDRLLLLTSRSASEPYTGKWKLPVLSTDGQITTTY